MLTEILVPTIADAGPKLSIGRWFKSAGDPVTSGEPLVEIDPHSWNSVARHWRAVEDPGLGRQLGRCRRRARHH
jgi:hypothetical protein